MTGYPYFPTTQAGFPWGYKIIIVNTKFLMCKMLSETRSFGA